MKKVYYSALAFLPALAFAQTGAPQTGTLQGIIDFIKSTVDALIPIIFGIALIYFFWGLAKFIRSAGDPKAQAEGKSIMIYGIIALAVMASVYGLIGWLQGTFDISSGGSIDLPDVPQN